MATLLAILTSTQAWAQTLVASAIKLAWTLTFVVAAVFSGCLTGCTFEVPPSPQLGAGVPQRDAGLLPSPRALARGPYDAEGAAAWQRFSDLMLRSLGATPNARTWAIIVFEDRLVRVEVESLLRNHELTLRRAYASNPACRGKGNWIVEDDESLAEQEADAAAYVLADQGAFTESLSCRSKWSSVQGFTYHGIVVEGTTAALRELREDSKIHRITPVQAGAGFISAIEYPEERR